MLVRPDRAPKDIEVPVMPDFRLWDLGKKRCEMSRGRWRYDFTFRRISPPFFILFFFLYFFLVVCPLRLVAFLTFPSYLYLMVLRARSRPLAGMAHNHANLPTNLHLYQPPSSISPPNHGNLPLPHSGNQPRSLLSPVYAVLHYEYHYILLHIKGHILNIYDSFFEHASVTGRANVKIFRDRLRNTLKGSLIDVFCQIPSANAWRKYVRTARN